MDNEGREILAEVVRRKGADICDDALACDGLLADLSALTALMKGAREPDPPAPMPAAPPAPPAAGVVATPVLVNPVDGASLILIPSGEFLMGSTDADNAAHPREKPQRLVDLDAYRIYRTPVTVSQYRAFAQAGGRRMPTAPSWGWKEDHPIVNVTWANADAYAKWAGGSLPTEAQWEKAARGTDGRVYPWGDQWDATRCQCSRKALGDAGGTSAVGSYPTGASPYGVLDMAGNVWEWCEDWLDEKYYAKAPERNPINRQKSTYRVLRGGSWLSNYPQYFRAADRDRDSPDDTGNGGGFRVVLQGSA